MGGMERFSPGPVIVSMRFFGENRVSDRYPAAGIVPQNGHGQRTLDQALSVVASIAFSPYTQECKTDTVCIPPCKWPGAETGIEDHMLRLTKKADYGLMALKYLAEQAGPGLGGDPSAAQSAKDIAEAYHIPPQLLAKILQTLAKAGLLVSHAGTNGGYALSRAASEISAFEVIRAIDGPLFITSCITIHGSCDLVGHCTIKEPLRKVNDSIKELLSGIRISDLADPAESVRAGDEAAVGGGLVSIAV